MAAHEAKIRHRDPNSEQPETTLHAGLPEETMGETHPEENHTSLERDNILDEAQHCRSGRGCSHTLLHFQAALDTAQETGTDIYMSSWDIKRAYDSPSKTDIKLAWMRLGIPPYIADYLNFIDSEEKTLNRTTAANTAWANKLIKSMPSTFVDEKLTQPSKAERGARQGAVLSPTTWIAFFDILLVALSSVKEQNILLPGLLGKLFTHAIHHTWMT